MTELDPQTLYRQFTQAGEQAETLLKLLEHETQVLKTGSPEEIQSVSERKQVLLGKMDDSGQRINELLANIKVTTDNAGISDYIEQAQHPRLQTAWETLQERLNACRDTNDLNGRMLQSQKEFLNKQVNWLFGHDPKPSQTYTSRGAVEGGGDGRSLGKV